MGDLLKVGRRAVLTAGFVVLLASCGGGGGGSGGNNGGGGGTTVTVSGKITFDRVPATASNGLDFSAVTQKEARGVVVKAIQGTSPTGSSIANGVTDSSGNYSLIVPANTTMLVRVDAQMDGFTVKNNAGGNALYSLVSSSFNSGNADSKHDLNAPSGWNGTRYVDANRAAAPFAILDTIFEARKTIVDSQASQSPVTFQPLDVFWSTANLPNTPVYCPADGRIGTTAYVTATTSDTACTTRPVPAGIYVLGSASGDDTDEFDQHVIAHEFGHYVEDQIVDRADSIGGSHGTTSRLDPRVAFGEGWGNAFSAMVLKDPAYKDTVLSGTTNGFNLENGIEAVQGWYSESSVGQVLWDAYDSQDEAGDAVHLGFGPVFDALRGANKNTDALSTIYSFIAALQSANASSASAIRDLALAHNIQGSGAFVESSTENNNAGDLNALPLYTPIDLNSQTAAPICTDAQFGQYNRLANRRFFTLTLSSPALVTINIFAGLNTVDPDLRLLSRGVTKGSATKEGNSDSIVNAQLAAGIYVIEAYDFDYANPTVDPDTTDNARHCFTLSVTGQ